MTEDFRRRNLIVDDDVAHYDGTTAVVRTEHVAADEIEFMRWREERWMKLRHVPSAFRHSPGFVLRYGPAMLAHTFAGSSVRSILGLESERAVFDRFKQQRRRERAIATAVDVPAPAVHNRPDATAPTTARGPFTPVRLKPNSIEKRYHGDHGGKVPRLTDPFWIRAVPSVSFCVLRGEVFKTRT